MDATPVLAAILRDARRSALLRMRSEVNFRFKCQTAMRTCARIPAARSARGLRRLPPSTDSRGRRESRMRAAPAVPCAEMVENAHEQTGPAEAIRLSLRGGLRLTPRSPW